MDIVRHLQIDMLNAFKEINLLRKENIELKQHLKEVKDVILNNVKKGVLLFLMECESCKGYGHIWPDDACKCCDDPIDCVKCKGKGEYWGKLCG